MKRFIIVIAMLMLICCGEAEATSKVEVPPVEIYLDDMTFTDAFRVQYLAKGEGSTFWWRSNEYTTNLAQITAIPDEFVVKHNKLDDCGVCDGPGKITWFRDKDGDGLGTFMEWITSCTYPTDMEIEKYRYESLLEGGGDQGY